MVTSDFVCPSTTLDAVQGDVDFRGSIRVWTTDAEKFAGRSPSPVRVEPSMFS